MKMEAQLQNELRMMPESFTKAESTGGIGIGRNPAWAEKAAFVDADFIELGKKNKQIEDRANEIEAAHLKKYGINF